MKFAIIINSKDPETVWNALRLGNKALEAKHDVTVSLLGSGVEIQDIKNEKFNVEEVLGIFIKEKGVLLACESCLKVRQQEHGVCSVSKMPQLVQLISDSDKVVTFG